MIFGERLCALRKSKGITQEELAQVLSVSRSAIAGYEAKNMEPDFDKLISIAKYFNVSVDYLIGHTDIPYVNFEIENLYNQLSNENRIKIQERICVLLEMQQQLI